MTPKQHKALEIKMKKGITRLNNKSKSTLLDLSEKIEMKREVKARRAELQNHVLNYYELVSE